MDIQEKKAFEIAFDNKLGARGCQFNLDEDGNYEDRETLCGWHMWQAAKTQAVPEKDAVIKKLSDQLYEQEMKTSAARVLCETACELLDDYAHQDAMVILNDLEQAMSTGASQ